MTLFKREHSNLSYSLPPWKRELINRRKKSIAAEASFSKVTSQRTAAAQYERYRHKNISEGYVTAANERAVDHSLSRQPDFHLQLCATIHTSISTLLECRSQLAVDNMKLVNNVGVVRDSTIKSDGVRTSASSSSRTDCIPRENYVKHVIEMNEEKCFDKLRIRNKFNSRKLHSFAPQPATDAEEENVSDSSEELQYGPGIVNKLKTKYMSMTLRDNQKKRLRPALSNLRKSSSLDNLLDGGELLDVSKRYQISSVISCVNKLEYSSKETSNCVTVNFSTDLKRTRSMEALQEENSSPSIKSVVVSKSKVTTNCSSKPPPAFESNGLNIPLDSIINDDIIIVENSIAEIKNSEVKQRRNLPVNKELPRPDVVKERLKIFETKCHKSSVKWWEQKSPSSGKLPVLYPKLVLERKPVLKIDENGSVLRNGHRTSAFSSIKMNFECKQSNSYGKVSHSTCICNETNSVNVNVKTSTIINAPNEGSPVVNGVTFKNVSSREIGADEHMKNENECKYRGILKSNDVLPVRQIGVIRPLVSQSSKNNILPLTPQEIHKNFLNTKKTLCSEMLFVNNDTDKSFESIKDKDISVNLTNNTNSPTDAVTKPSTLCIKKAWNQQQNTMVFNFKDRKEVPDYIENDSLLMSTNRERAKRVLQEGSGTGYIILGNETGDVADESSTDLPNISCREEWQAISGPPSPCNVYFVGDNVVINGKSNLRKRPKEKKLRIKFNDTSTTFEYPSEASLLAEDSHNGSISDEEPPPPLYISSPELLLIPCSGSKMQPPLSGGNGLASYVPCKLGMGEIFELGVTKSNNSAVSNPSDQSTASNLPNGETNLSSEFCISGQQNTTLEENEYLRPADETENVVWSEESIPDLLF